jgi:hypothetical protein
MKAVHASGELPKLEVVSPADSRPTLEQAGPDSKSAFLPMLLTLFSLVLWFGFQTFELGSERHSYQRAVARQAVRVEQLQQVRGAFDALSADTSRLAAAGNPNAQLLVDALKKRGVSLNSDTSPPQK